MESDYNEEHGFQQDDHYCKHGKYLVSPYGADLMCGLCESGCDYPIEYPIWVLVVTTTPVDREAYSFDHRTCIDSHEAVDELLSFYQTMKKSAKSYESVTGWGGKDEHGYCTLHFKNGAKLELRTERRTKRAWVDKRTLAEMYDEGYEFTELEVA